MAKPRDQVGIPCHQVQGGPPLHRAASTDRGIVSDHVGPHPHLADQFFFVPPKTGEEFGCVFC